MPDKKIVWFLIAVIIILFIGISNNFNETVKQGIENLPEGCGLNVLSLDSVSYKQGDSLLNWDDSILLTVVLSEENECAYGYFEAENINKKLEEKGFDKKVQYDFDIMIDSLEQTCDYKITPRKYDRVYTIMRSQGQQCHPLCYGCKDCNYYISECKNSAEYYDYAFFDYTYNNGEVFCFHEEMSGFLGTIGNPLYNFPVEITVRNYKEPSKSGKIILDATKARSQWIVDDFVYAEWNGYLMSEVSCPSLTDYNSGYSSVREVWSVNRQKYKDDYNMYYSSITHNCIDDVAGDPQGTVGELEECVANHNKVAYKLLTFDDNIIWDWAGSYKQVISGDEYAGDLTLIANKKLAYPVITFHVNADWMGIYSPVGIPKIKEINPTQIDFVSNE
ncbi:MAG: hypothetical protein ACTSQ8_19155, partial [Candidatus Helarchaeota archaeon]